MIVLAVVGLSSCAKLDKTYLPPNAQTSGGSDNFLQTPNFSGPLAYQGTADNSNYAQAGNGFSQNSFAPRPNGAPTNEYQNGNGFASPNSLTGNNFSQDGNEYASVDGGNSNYVQNGNGFGQNAFNSDAGFAPSRPERPRAALERNAAILRQDMQNDGENFAYSFETENGIYAEESGVATNGVEAQGAYSYTGDDGQVYSVRYTADQNGFVATGDHLPTAPPVPEEILKALEQNARDEAAGIYDDGQHPFTRLPDWSFSTGSIQDDQNQCRSYQEGKYANSEDTNQQYNNGNENNGNLNYENGNENFGNGNSNFGNGNQNYDDRNFAANGNQNTAGNYNSDSDDTVVTNSATAYLPPLERQTAQVRNQQPSFANQQPSFANQKPSFANQQPSFANQQSSFANQQPSFAGQQPAYANRQPASANQQPSFANQKSAVNGVTNAYLPPRDQPIGAVRFSAQGTQQRPTNFGHRMNGLRRPSFNARDGYQY
ncbi:hypothetical protein JYU34_014108 [Plutella xylostella]|uniref:Cuticular protein n=1 Tax=Plutella xylostella TaxID=51655 RepID=A0ABQ7Q7Z4_PLUXY|nr:hypothetical protein JYU34_014108 [Plutella xylostella]